jgi:hypothetical protein
MNTQATERLRKVRIKEVQNKLEIPFQACANWPKDRGVSLPDHVRTTCELHHAANGGTGCYAYHVSKSGWYEAWEISESQEAML